MANRRVRVGSTYRYVPVLWDAPTTPHLTPGDIVRVVNLPGCPPAGTMGHCHVEFLNGRYGALVVRR